MLQDDLYLKPGPAKSMQELGLIEEPTSSPTTSKSGKKTRILPLTENELKLRNKKDKATISSQLEPNGEPFLQCKNFGCQKKFRESQNRDRICQHHIKPPIFHETRKYWACWYILSFLSVCLVDLCFLALIK